MLLPGALEDQGPQVTSMYRRLPVPTQGSPNVALFALTVRVAQFVVGRIRRQPVTLKMPPKTLWLFIVIALVFAVVRNLPGFEWFSP